MCASVKKLLAMLFAQSLEIAKSWPKRAICVTLHGLLSPIAKCQNRGMRNILSLVTYELYRWACITGLVAVAISWVGLVISIEWLMRIVRSTRSSVTTSTPAIMADIPEIPGQQR